MQLQAGMKVKVVNNLAKTNVKSAFGLNSDMLKIQGMTLVINEVGETISHRLSKLVPSVRIYAKEVPQVDWMWEAYTFTHDCFESIESNKDVKFIKKGE